MTLEVGNMTSEGGTLILEGGTTFFRASLCILRVYYEQAVIIWVLEMTCKLQALLALTKPFKKANY